jgi:hypothetical protein
MVSPSVGEESEISTLPGTMAMSGGRLNPYKIGIELFQRCRRREFQLPARYHVHGFRLRKQWRLPASAFRNSRQNLLAPRLY